MTAVNHTECNEWTGYRNPDGYGQCWNPRRKIMQAAHRVAWEDAYGSMPDGVLRHKCDNPSCVNVDHLEVGTHADNVADRHARGRDARGAALPHTKLNEEAVFSIRDRLTAGESLGVIAGDHGVTKQAIARVRDGKSWAWLQ
jgi:hypothetical protein